MTEYLKYISYSGSKHWVLPYLKPLPEYTRSVELYAGSMAFSLNQKMPAVGYDTSPAIVQLFAMLEYAKTKEESRFLGLLQRAATIVQENPGIDVEKAIDDYADTVYYECAINPNNTEPNGFDYMYWLIKCYCCGLYSGQMGSRKIYPQHRIPIEKMMRVFREAPPIHVVHGSAELYTPEPGDLVFIDPPYHGTDGGYGKGYNPESTRNIVNMLKETQTPYIFTYGDGAATVFPGEEWTLVKTKSVPNLRNRDVAPKSRGEYISYGY